MIHVKIDIVPHGSEDGRRQISELFIANVSTDPMSETAKYAIWKVDPREAIPRPEPLKHVYHKRTEGCDVLVLRALNNVYPGLL